MTAVALRQRIFPAAKKTEPVLIDGKPIAHRTLQKYLWPAGVGLILGLVISGLYFGLTQVNWYIHIGSFYRHLFWLKRGWDDGVGQWLSQHTWFINLKNWSTYRHNARNLGAPGFATVGVMSIVAGASRPAGKIYTTVAIVMLPVLLALLIAGGTWVELSSVDHLHEHGFAVGTVSVAEAAVLGFVIGRILHPVMKPAGTRIQDAWTDWAVDRYWRKGGGQLPVWIRRSLAPVTARESAMKRIQADQVNPSTKVPHLTEAQYQMHRPLTLRSHLVWLAVALGVIVILGLAALGFTGHFLVGVLHMSIPYLAP
jgi:hypothetical protein